MGYDMYFDDIETQLHAIININQMLIEKIQKKRKLVIFRVCDGTTKYADNIAITYFVLGNMTMEIDFKLVCTEPFAYYDFYEADINI